MHQPSRCAARAGNAFVHGSLAAARYCSSHDELTHCPSASPKRLACVRGIITCGAPLNDGPQHFVVNAAFAALNRWVRRGTPPRSAPRLDVAAGPPVAIQLDANGVAHGGIRTPQVDAPIARFTGLQAGSLLCQLFGTTTLFDDSTLHTLYPTPKSFRSRFKRSLRHALRAGWIRPTDANLMKEWLATADIGG
jgi:hypothetical protein